MNQHDFGDRFAREIASTSADKFSCACLCLDGQPGMNILRPFRMYFADVLITDCIADFIDIIGFHGNIGVVMVYYTAIHGSVMEILRRYHQANPDVPIIQVKNTGDFEQRLKRFRFAESYQELFLDQSDDDDQTSVLVRVSRKMDDPRQEMF
jgi:hypothetical protein